MLHCYAPLHVACYIVTNRVKMLQDSNRVKIQYYTLKKWFNVAVDLWLVYINNTGKAAKDFNFQNTKDITVYSSLIFVRLDLVCNKCNQFIHPAKDEEYEIFLKLCKGEFSVPVRSKLQKSTIIKFWRNREKFKEKCYFLMARRY